MTELETLYQLLDQMRARKYATEDIQKDIVKEEEAFLAEALPQITDAIADALKPLRCTLDITGRRLPDGKVDLQISRAEPQKEPVMNVVHATDPEEVKEELHFLDQESNEPATAFTVTFPDGSTIHHHDAVQTAVMTIRRIGVERAREACEKCKLTLLGYPIVATKGEACDVEERFRIQYALGQRKSDRSPYVEIDDKWRYECYTDTATKIRQLQKISDFLHLGLRFEQHLK
ncbi:MAG: hypothetical protein LIO90_01805 [Bacteroidales bacterium]|nr:hypothetical protein [Bacteroidales bacterium]